MQTSHFDEDELRDNAVGAGVLPIMINTNGKISVILGRERTVPNWKGSQKWSGFEGGRKFPESVEETAAREFYEESMGIVAVDSSGDNVYDAVLRVLRSKQYVTRIALCIHKEKPPLVASTAVASSNDKYHVTYVVQVPYQADLPERFADLRKRLVQLQKIQGSLKTLRAAFPDASPYIKEGMTHGQDTITGVIKADVLEDRLCVLFSTSNLTVNARQTTIDCTPQATAYAAWIGTKNKLQTVLRDIQPYDVFRGLVAAGASDASPSMHERADVVADFIEKEEVRVWELADLAQVLANGGFLHTHFFRVYFLPVLQIAVREIHLLHPTLFLPKKILP